MKEHQICGRCVMDTSDPEITFDSKGECNYCEMFDEMWSELPKGRDARKRLDQIMNRIKEDGTGKRYDALLGESGGIDSSFATYIAKQYGLNLLLVHSDNGFDSPISQRNIGKIVKHTGYDLLNYEVDAEEFKDLNIAFLKASVVDTDVPADHAIVAVVFKTAVKYDIHYLVSGGNQATEFYMPRTWTFADKCDLVHMRNIHKQFGKVRIRNFPTMGIIRVGWNRRFHRIKRVYPLNYVRYNKNQAMRFLMRKWGWEPYGHKHNENIFSRFYQNHILYAKFGIDKRKAHFSALIRTRQITRERALEDLEKPPYAPTDIYGVSTGGEDWFEKDKEFVLEKLGLSESEFDEIMGLARVPHKYYGTDRLGKIMLKLFHVRSALVIHTRVRRLMK